MGIQSSHSEALADLVNSIQPSSKFEGSASFTSPQTAKIEYARAPSSLRNIYSLLQAFHDAGAIGEIEIGPHDAVSAYNDVNLPLKVARNALLGLEPNGNPYVEIHFDHPDLIARQLREARTSAAQYAAWEEEDARRESMPPVSGRPEEDAKLAAEYLVTKAFEAFPERFMGVAFTKSVRPVKGRPVHSYPALRAVVARLPGDDETPYTNFHLDLTRIFTGIQAVQSHGLSEDQIAFDVVGNPSRLLADILRNDRAKYPIRQFMDN